MSMSPAITTSTSDSESMDLRRPPPSISAPVSDSKSESAALINEYQVHLDPDEAQFFLSQTGISTIEELKAHIGTIRDEALKVHAYPCIHRFFFARLRISKHPRYEYFIESMKKEENKDAVLLDMGCCFGTDMRKAIADGCSEERVVGFDLHPEFWQLGHKLFRSDPEKISPTFFGGDFLAGDGDSVPGLSDNYKVGRIKYIHASNFFHLFSEERQKNAAKRFLGLLLSHPSESETQSSLSGAMIFGSHAGRPVKGFRTEAPPPTPGKLGSNMFCHSPESWRELWEELWKEATKGTGRGKGDSGLNIQVEAKIVEPRTVEEMLVPEAVRQGARYWRLVWSVTLVEEAEPRIQ